MTDRSLKVYENRMRRKAERQGLQLRKSRRRDPDALSYGTYGLYDPKANTLAAGDGEVFEGYGLTLEDVERYLTERSQG